MSAVEPSPASAPAAAGTARRRLIRNAASLSVGQLITRALSILAVPVLAHKLGPTRLGELSLAQTIAVFLTALGDGGLTTWTYRQIVLAPRTLSRLVVDTTAVQVGLALSIGAVMVLIALVAPLQHNTGSLLLLFSPFALTQALSLAYALQALERMGSVAVIKIVIQFVTSVGSVALVLATDHVIWVPVVWVTSQLIGDAITVVLLRLKYGLSFLRPNLAAAGRLLRAGFPLLLSIFLITIWGAVPMITLAALRSAHDLGIYAAPASLITAAWVLSEVAAGATMPELVRRARDDRAGLATLVDVLVRLTTRITLAVLVLGIVEAEPLMRFAYGSHFAASGSPMRILMICVPAGWYAWTLAYLLVAAGHQRSYTLGLAVAAACATVLTPPAIALLGLDGAALAASLSAIAMAVAFSVSVRRKLGLVPILAALREWRYAVIPLVALLAVGAVLHGLVPALLAWALAVAAVEALGGMATLRELRGLPRPIT